jgi:hypothetical protein
MDYKPAALWESGPGSGEKPEKFGGFSEILPAGAPAY